MRENRGKHDENSGHVKSNVKTIMLPTKLSSFIAFNSCAYRSVTRLRTQDRCFRRSSAATRVGDKVMCSAFQRNDIE